MSWKNAFVAAITGGFTLYSATSAFAGSEIQPGITTGLALGAPLPEGVYVFDLPNYGYRDATPGQSVGALAPAWIVWSTPWTFLGGHILFDAASPMANVNIHGIMNRGGFANPIIDSQIKWDLGNGFFGGFHAGVYLPVEDDLSILGIARNFASFQAVGAFSYLKDGWNLSVTTLVGAGKGGDAFSVPGSYGPAWVNVDVTATKKFGKFEFGFVGFGSADIDDPVPGYARQSQIAMGGLMGYDFQTLTLQVKVTRDIAETNYGGYDTRVWGNIIIPVWVAAAPPASAIAAKY